MLNSVDREYFQFVDNFCYYILLGTILSELWCVSPIMLYCTLGSGAGGRRPHADTLMSDERDAMYVSHVVMAHGRLS